MKKRLSILFSVIFFSSASAGVKWGYDGDKSPEKWGELSEEYKTCATGQNQSPIDINNTMDVVLEPLNISFSQDKSSVVNNGHTVQVNVKENSVIVLDNQRFNLKQFHFHAPSENLINGQSFPMEAHFVYQNNEGKYLVLGVMYEEGKEHPELAKVWKHLSEQLNVNKEVSELISIEKLLPENLDYYRFNGSLTTPPCSEGVFWIVLKNPVVVSKAQIDAFRVVMKHDNNRPIQALNARIIVE